MKNMYEKMKEVIQALSIAEQDKDHYYSIFKEAFDELKETLVCPVCGAVGKVDYHTGCSYHELECKHCNFNTGRGKTIAEVAKRWDRINDALWCPEVKK
ncbi:MAG: hypothetical protein IJH67_08190 [Thermoguttaceae bacterium]|nr:hypothetical protein [Thermoguttaceae bacterium]